MAYTKEPVPTELMHDANGNMTPAWRAYFDSNVKQNFTQVESDVSNAATKTEGATGNLAVFDENGDITNSQISITNSIFNTEKMEHIAEADAVTAITAVAGVDQINRATLNTAFTTQAEEINALKTVINSLLTALQAAGIMESEETE
jgi:predicted ester cyclase